MYLYIYQYFMLMICKEIRNLQLLIKIYLYIHCIFFLERFLFYLNL